MLERLVEKQFDGGNGREDGDELSMEWRDMRGEESYIRAKMDAMKAKISNPKTPISISFSPSSSPVIFLLRFVNHCYNYTIFISYVPFVVLKLVKFITIPINKN